MSGPVSVTVPETITPVLLSASSKEIFTSAMAQAARLATSAAGVVVGKLGTAVVTRAELDAALN